MTTQWRLNNGKELYDIKADPGQKKNVAADHPAVAKRLTKFYDDWWTELEPTFKQDAAIYLGHPAENPATLTCHDWITTGSTPWNQASVRAGMTGKANTGFWNVNVVEDGTYEIEIRRWPKESKKTLDAALPPGADVPGVSPYRARPGKPLTIVKAEIEIGDQKAESEPVKAGTHSVIFALPLKAGRTRLSARFVADDGTVYGAYYAYVRKN